MTMNYSKIGGRMSQKFISDTELHNFKKNMKAHSEEQQEHYRQDILDFERRYQGQYNKNMIDDYKWAASWNNL